MKRLLAASALVLAAPLGAQAGEAMVTAKNPQGIVDTLKAAGYDAELTADGAGDPLVVTELSGWSTRIYFYGCDETSHDGCDAVQFSAGFDRKEPWTAEKAMALARTYRFSSTYLDDEGDPYIEWDVITGDGIPAPVFLASVLGFSDAIDVARSEAFADETAE